MMKKLAIAAVAVWSLAGGAAFAQPPADEKPSATASTTTAGQAMSDAAITSAVKTKLTADKAVGGLRIDVDTSHGVVTLTGPVKSAAERARAVRLARDTSGVTRVVDKLTVGATEPTSGHVGADKSKDTTIVIKDDVTPKVKKGAEKTADVAKEVAGKTAEAAKKTGKAVKDTNVEVKDDVSPHAKKAGAAVADDSITTAVKTRLMSDEVARGTAIDVDTRDGVVTIVGAVPTAADKARIGELVQKTTGVKRVVNNLTVK